MQASNHACPHHEIGVVVKNETYLVKGESITIEAQVPTCKECKEEIFVPRYDDANLKKAYDIYRKKHNLLSAERIVDLRQRYQLSQRAFAALIDCTQATINRYEKGAIPDGAYNSLIRLMENPQNVRDMLEERRSELDVKDAEKLDRVLERMFSDTMRMRDVFSLLQAWMVEKPSKFSGFKKFDRTKCIAMVLFFAKNQKDLYKTKLMKLLWYSDMLNFKNYVKSISGMRYVHQNYGPVPQEHELLLGVLKAAGYIDLVSAEEQSGEKIQALVDPDMSCFTKDELEILEKVNARFKDVMAVRISAISHDEDAYIQTEQLELISYEYAATLKAVKLESISAIN